MAEDIKENEMQNGKPARLRGIDTDGNSITPTMEEVTDALPGEKSTTEECIIHCLSPLYLSINQLEAMNLRP